MTAPKINGLLDAIADDIRVWLPALKTCRVHGGRWAAGEIKRWAVAAPAVAVAALGVERVERSGIISRPDADLSIAVYCLARDAPGLGRDAAVRAIAEAILGRVPAARWGAADDVLRGPAARLRAGNLYDAGLDQAGVAMWAVTWRQTVRLDAQVGEDCPALPGELYSSLAAGALT